MTDQRLTAVYDAASYLFIKQGYAKTQVSEIADRAKIATGTVYNLFTGKKAILHFVLLCTLDKHYLDRDVALPVEQVDSGLITRLLSQVVEDLFSKIGREGQHARWISFTEMLSTLFDFASNYQVAFNIINDNPVALKDVELVYRGYVEHLYVTMNKYMSHYIEVGEVRLVELPALHIRNILEGITWWSMYLPYQTAGTSISVEQAKEIALDILVHAYLTKP